jgi:hypothetical protein
MLCTIGIVAGKTSFPIYGTLLGTYCTATSAVDAISQYWSGSWDSWGIYADGYGGSFNTSLGSNNNGCFIPYGFYYSYDPYQGIIYWSHGTESGAFSYGDGYNATISDGNSGSINIQNFSLTVTDGQVVHSYTATDGATGYPANYILYFRASDSTLQNTSYIVAGTLVGQSCTTLYNQQDAAGNIWNVGAREYMYADGVGGYYYTYQTDVQECGYLPSGYYTQYSYEELYISYYTYEGNPQTFNYGFSTASQIADGINGSTVGASTTIYNPAGYIFYSYYDVAGQQTVNYVFDGIQGYAIVYS